MHQSVCTSCALDLSDSDNFCRNCGAPVARAQLPAVSGKTSITIWKPQASPVVKGAAVMAAGTVGQFLVRRVVSALLRDGPRPGNKRRAIKLRGGREDGLVDEAQIITETVMMRRVRIRRPA